MTPVHARETHGRLDSVRRALQPYQWRRVTPAMLARLVLAAADRADRTGMTVGTALVSRDDIRVEVLVRCLEGLPWRGLTVRELSRRLLEALEDWELRDRCLDLEIAWLLDESA